MPGSEAREEAGPLSPPTARFSPASTDSAEVVDTRVYARALESMDWVFKRLLRHCQGVGVVGVGRCVGGR